MGESKLDILHEGVESVAAIRALICFAAFSSVLVSAVGCKSRAEWLNEHANLLAELKDTVQDTNEQLASINDLKSLEAVKPTLKAFAGVYERTKSRAREIAETKSAGIPLAEMSKVEDQVRLLHVIAAVLSFPFDLANRANRRIEKGDIELIDEYLRLFRAEFSEYPQELTELTSRQIRTGLPVLRDDQMRPLWRFVFLRQNRIAKFGAQTRRMVARRHGRRDALCRG
jgi:hypothetical protein